MTTRVFIGWDGREPTAWKVCAASLVARSVYPPIVAPVTRTTLERSGLYERPTVRDERGVLIDLISKAPMSTDFSLARFWVPHLARERSGWVLFCDCDFLFRASVEELFALRDRRYAVMVVKHKHKPSETTKMDAQPQTRYARKNWSSLMLWNLEHPSLTNLSPHLLNTAAGTDLHQFCWLKDEEIGALSEEWNWLDGHSSAELEPKAVHFTRGTPDMIGYEHTRYAPEWNRYAQAFIGDAK